MRPTHAPSLEDAYLGLTHGSVEYRGTGQEQTVTAGQRDRRSR